MIQLMKLGLSASWCDEQGARLINFQPIVMVVEIKAGEGGGGANQLAMDGTTACHQRVALGLDDDEDDDNVVYGLLLSGERLRLYVACIQSGDVNDGGPGRRVVRCSPHPALLIKLNMMPDIPPDTHGMEPL
jgi:hypothetical protein